MMGHWQDAEKVAFLTRPTLARRDAPFPMHRSRLVKILVTERVRLRFQLVCGLVGSLFEHSARVGWFEISVTH